MEALQYLKDKYRSNDNSLYFSEPDLPLSTSLERICKYMQEYAESHTAAHTAGLREEIRQLQSDVAHNADKALEIAMERDALREGVKELEALMQEFVDRVDKGEVRSVKTYAKFKEALK